MQTPDLISNSAFGCMTLICELNPGGGDKMWTLLSEELMQNLVVRELYWSNFEMRGEFEKGDLPNAESFWKWGYTLPGHDKQPASQELRVQQREKHWFFSASIFAPKIQNAAMMSVRSKAMNLPGVLDGVLANSNGEELKWLVRPPLGTFVYFTVCLIVSHLYVIPEAVPSLRPTHRGKVTLLSRQTHKAQYLALLSSTSECIHIFMGTVSKIWKC